MKNKTKLNLSQPRKTLGRPPKNADIDLRGLLTLRSAYRSGWTVDQAEKLVLFVMTATSNGHPYKLKSIYEDFCEKFNKTCEGKKPGGRKTPGGCAALIKEFKLAANDGMRLREYWAKGRPHKYIFQGKK